MKVIFFRIYQFFLKIANYFVNYRTPQYISGIDSLKQIGEQVRQCGIQNVLVVTGRHVCQTPFFKTMVDSLKQQDISYYIFSDIQANPTDINVLNGYQMLKEHDCEAIIMIGGGSPMDCAKAIAAKAAQPKKSIHQLQGLLKVHRKTLPMWAIPTTSGTGSETTIAAVITEEATHHKAAINDPALLPDYAIFDPLVTVNLPQNVTAFSGMDALCHAVEAYTNYTYCTFLEKDLALKAVKLICENLENAYLNPQDLQARQAMQVGAFYAGRAFTRGCVGYVHAIGHTISGLYDLPHGEVMAVLLPIVLRQYGSKVSRRLGEIAHYAGFEGDTKEASEAFIEWIETMNAKMGIPAHLDCIRKEDMEQMIRWADKEGNPLYPVPMIWDHDDFEKCIRTLKG